MIETVDLVQCSCLAFSCGFFAFPFGFVILSGMNQ